MLTPSGRVIPSNLPERAWQICDPLIEQWQTGQPQLYAAGSCLAGVVFGLMRFAGKPERRWLLGICAMAVSMIPLLLVGNLPLLAVALFVAGLSIAPTMITTMSLIEKHVPRAKLTEGMTWVSTGLAVGVAAHETGHAIQHQIAYAPLNMRMAAAG